MSINANVALAKSDYDRAFAAGKQAAYDAFWDAYQDFGKLDRYEGSFMGYGWNKNTFNPKYDLHPTNASKMFDHHAEQKPYDLKKHLDSIGRVLDFSKCTNLTQTFMWSGITHLGEVDTRSCANITSLFYAASQIVTVDKLILKADGSQSIDTNAFHTTLALVSITIEGVIGKTTSFEWSTKLSEASIRSIINALSTTTTGLTVTLSKTAVNNAFATAEGAADGSTSAEWLALVATRSNWTIALA